MQSKTHYHLCFGRSGADNTGSSIGALYDIWLPEQYSSHEAAWEAASAALLQVCEDFDIATTRISSTNVRACRCISVQSYEGQRA